ncbi:MAG: hypothetical protein ABW036_05005, partial [Flavitalea sp.]
MKKLVPVVLFTLCASVASAQTSKEKSSDSQSLSFAESLRQEVLTGIKQKMSTDTSMQRKQENMKEYYKACGVQQNSARISGGTSTTKVYRIAPESIAIIN